MATELASGYVSLTVKYADAMKDIQSKIGGGAEQAGIKSGQRYSKGFHGATAGLGKRFASTFKKVVSTAGFAGIGVTAGAALVGGFKSAVDKGTARKTLAGLYGDAEKARDTLQKLNDVASKSPIDASAYRKAGESLAYAGVQGDQAVEVLKNVGAAITAAGGSSENMNRATDAVLKMVNAGKVSLDSLQQLSDAGVPIISGLADKFGKSMDDINKDASDGAIALDDVIDVMQNATGGTFQQMLDASEQASQSFGNQWKIAKDNVSEALGDMFAPLLEKIAPHLQSIAETLTDSIKGVVDVLGGVFGAIKDNKGLMIGLGTAASGVAAGFAAIKVQQAGMFVVGQVQAMVTAFRGWKTATEGMTVAQRALNLVMRANPLGLIVAAIAAVVTGLVLFFTKTETGRKIWQKFTSFLSSAWETIKSAFSSAWDFIKGVWDKFTGAIGNVIAFIKEHWKLIPILFGPVGAAVSLILTKWDDIKAGATAVWNWVRDKFTAMVDFITGLPPKIGAAAKGMWEGLKTGLKSAINWIIDKLNGLTGGIGNIVSKIPGVNIDIPAIPHLAAGGQVRGPGTATSDSILARLSNGEGVVIADAMRKGGAELVAALNAGWTPSPEMLRAIFGDVPGYAKGLTPHSQDIRQRIMGMWPTITSVGGWRPEDGYHEHSTGNALDVMIPNWKTDEGKALGNSIAGWALKNAEALGLDWVIWRQAIYKPGSDGTGSPMQDRGSPTQNHMDHVHIFMNQAPDPKIPLQGPLLKTANNKTAHRGTGKPPGPSKTGRGTTSDGPDSPYEQMASKLGELADIGKSGIMDSFLPPGFDDPTQWGVLKEGSALLGFIGGLTNDPTAKALLGAGSSALGGDAGGTVSALTSLMPKPFGQTQIGSPKMAPSDFNAYNQIGSQSSVAGGLGNMATSFIPDAAAADQGQQVNIDNSTNIGQNGQVGWDPAKVRETTRRDQTAKQRQYMGTKRF